ncbi:MAG: hypothetical protein K0S15_431 [Solirubrobacterales bacterium]|nr:hypothetical protein [Solirubrobacterales bacterium]
MELMGYHAHAQARPRAMRALIACLALAATLAIALQSDRADAAPKVTVLGAATPVNPSCPANCQAIGKTTGFQTQIGRTTNPFRVPFAGKVVAWSIKLGRPSSKVEGDDEESQMEFFNRFFGGPPTARLAVLKPIMKKIKEGKPIYKLKSQSPLEQLTPYLGQTTTFTLQRPLTVKPNQVVALTVPTWAPAFAVGTGNRTAWQASRKRGTCNSANDIRAGKPQQAPGKERAYGCTYRGARVLYSATLVKRPGG